MFLDQGLKTALSDIGEFRDAKRCGPSPNGNPLWVAKRDLRDAVVFQVEIEGNEIRTGSG
jgi:hypothetical protein